MKLIQTSVCSIIYGDFRGEKNQELFRCPRELDGVDLKNYINRNRCVLGFENDDTEKLREVEGSDLIGYYRLYFRGGRWYGRWFLEDGKNPSKLDCVGVDRIVRHLEENFQNGCSWDMIEHMSDNYEKWGGANRYLIKPLMSDKYKIMVDTTYGNSDYPVRIYVYGEKETK